MDRKSFLGALLALPLLRSVFGTREVEAPVETPVDAGSWDVYTVQINMPDFTKADIMRLEEHLRRHNRRYVPIDEWVRGPRVRFMDD